MAVVFTPTALLRRQGDPTMSALPMQPLPLRGADELAASLLDTLSRCAAQVAHCPAVRISFLDEEQQYVKADVGFELAALSIGSVLCREAQRRRTPMLVSDLQRDPRFAKEAFYLGNNALRFYAGFPVGLGAQQSGVLCVFDTQPRHLQPEQIDALAALAQSVSLWLENRQYQALLAERESRMRDFLSVSREQLWECDASAAVTWCSPLHDDMLERGCPVACALEHINAPLGPLEGEAPADDEMRQSLLARRERFVQRVPHCNQHTSARPLEFLGYRGTLRRC
jgi:GAF domain